MGWVPFDLVKEGNEEKEKGIVRACQTSNLPKMKGKSQEKKEERKKKKEMGFEYLLPVDLEAFLLDVSPVLSHWFLFFSSFPS